MELWDLFLGFSGGGTGIRIPCSRVEGLGLSPFFLSCYSLLKILNPEA